MVILVYFPFFRIREEPTTKQLKDKVLNVEGDLGEKHLVKNIIKYCKLWFNFGIFLFLFSNGDFPSHICSGVFSTASFLENFTFFLSKYFDTRLRSYFFRAATFFFKSVASSQQFLLEWLHFDRETSTEQPILDNR